VNIISPVFWVSLSVSLVLHESAHLAMAYLAGVRVKHIGLSWKGPYIVREAGTPIKNTLISLAGPGINLLLCVLCWHLSQTFTLVNGFLALLNLLPIPSSDGLRVYRIWRGPSGATRVR
jgi:Zn-dependent protease